MDAILLCRFVSFLKTYELEIGKHFCCSLAAVFAAKLGRECLECCCKKQKVVVCVVLFVSIYLVGEFCF